MEEISTTDAQAQFRDLIARARQGEETIITDHGRPVARLSPVVDHAEPGDVATNWADLWHRMRERARLEGVAPFTDEERKALRDEGRR